MDSPAHPDELPAPNASSEISRVLDCPPVSSIDLSSRGATVQLWRHGALHATTRPMADHVLMTYSGIAKSIERRTDGHVVRSHTRAGTITLIPAGDESRWDIDGPLNATHFYVSAARLNGFAEQTIDTARVDPVPRTAEDDAVGGRLLTMLATEMNATRHLSRLFIEQMSDLICLQILREHSSLQNRPVRSPRGGLAGWQVRRVTEYLENHLADDVSLSDLAVLTGLSSFHLCRAFKQSTGLPPYRWRAERRLERARELLDRTDLPVTEIAAQVGYDDPGRFAAAFRRSTGLSPSQYRRERRS